jgi:short-subunit dehydrogenase
MVVHNTGKVIIIGSKSALKGYSTGSLYCSLKMAHIGFFESVKKELKKCHSSVTVSLIHPDSFSSISKKHIDDSNPIIKKILVLINKIVNKDKFGQFYVFEWRTRLFLSSYFFLKMFNLIK